MAKRKWAETGVTNLEPVAINSEQREQIRLQLRNNKILSPPEEFFESLTLALAEHQGFTDLKEISKPSKVESNLKSALEAAFSLNDSLNALDGNSRELISEAGADISKLQRSCLTTIVSALNNGLILAREYPSGAGRLADNGREHLAVMVALAVEKHLGRRATSTKDGLYESLLAVVLEAATGKPVTSTHDLAQRAIRRIKKDV